MTIDLQLIEDAGSTDPDLRQRAALKVAGQLSDQMFPLALELLGDRDWRVRKTIVEALVQRADETVTEALLDALRDAENAGKRNSATEALVRIGGPALARIAAAVERETDPDVRLSLVNLLGDLRSEPALDALLRMLAAEEDVNILSSTASSIGRYRDSRAIPVLIRTLQRPDPWLKFHLIEALGDIGDRSALPAILPLYAEKSLRKPILEAVGKIGDVGTVNFLLKVIGEEEKLNLTALRALVQIAEAEKPKLIEMTERQLIQRKFRESFPPAKMPALIDHLRATPKREVRLFILRFLGWSGDERALRELIEHLSHPDSAEAAAEALTDFGASAVPAVLTYLRNCDDDEVVALLLRVINIIGGRETVPSVISFLDHPNPMIRRLAIETLGQVTDPSTVDYLLARLDDEDVACQQAAVNSISSLVVAFPEISADTLARIRKLLVSPSVPTRLNSLSIFVNIQGEGYHDELLLASKHGDAAIRQKAVSLMGRFSEDRFGDQLVLSLADESTQVRVAAIESLVRLRPEQGLAPLISSLEDDDVWIRAAAAQALGEYRDPAATAALMRHVTDDVAPVKIAALDALGKSESIEVLPILFERAADSDAEMARAAIIAMAQIPGEEAYEAITHYLSHDDWRVRAAAVSALGIRGDLRGLEQLHRILTSDSDAFVQQSAVLALDRMPDRSSFPYLLKALDHGPILDELAELFVRHKELFRDQLEEAWRKADSRHERLIAAILQAMKGV
jgi:HEAT repeat protein